jgi:hypothetical protein
MYHVIQWYNWFINIATHTHRESRAAGISGKAAAGAQPCGEMTGGLRGVVPIGKMSNRYAVEFSTTQI